MYRIVSARSAFMFSCFVLSSLSLICCSRVNRQNIKDWTISIGTAKGMVIIEEKSYVMTESIEAVFRNIYRILPSRIPQRLAPMAVVKYLENSGLSHEIWLYNSGHAIVDGVVYHVGRKNTDAIEMEIIKWCANNKINY